MVISSDNDNGGVVVTEAVMVALFVGLAVDCVDCETWEGALLLLSIVEIEFFLIMAVAAAAFPSEPLYPLQFFLLFCL